MPSKKSNYISKQVSFTRDNDEEMRLYKWLQKLPHGQFSAETKNYWLSKMKGEEQK